MFRLLKYPLIILSLFYFFQVIAQNQKYIDSLQRVIDTAPDDTNKTNTIHHLWRAYYDDNPKKALEYAKMELILSHQLNYRKGVKLGHTLLGYNYISLNEYSKAIEYFHKALKAQEEDGDKKGTAQSLAGIANVYFIMENYQKALEYFLKTLALMEDVQDKWSVAVTLGNIGYMYSELGDYENALKYQNKALEQYKKLGDKSGIANIQLSMGSTLSHMGNKDEALKYYEQSLALSEELKEEAAMATNLNNICEIHTVNKNFIKALEFGARAYKIAQELEDPELKKFISETISKTYLAMGDYKNAYNYHIEYSEIKDSLFNEESVRSIAELNTKYETEKKEQQIQIQHLQISKKDLELNQKQLTVYAAVGGIMLALLLAFFAYRGYRLKQKSNKLLEEKNILIEAQKKLVEERNRDITDSITYAKRIQEAILPEKQKILEALPESFILYIPKDIVSGDFYWHTQIENGQALIAAADCTGHGVPGAFMSMIGSNTLTKIVAEKNITQPAEILNHLNSEIKISLKQKSDYNSSKDGMDIALCSLEFGVRSSETNLPTTDSSLTTKLQYAGANRPLIYFENAEMKEIVPDKTAIGGFTDDCYMFINHTLELQKGTMIYIFSDGYADQFGGPRGKKFMLKNFKELLKTIKNFPVAEQEKTLREVHLAWKGNVEQVDDVLVIGIRV